MKLTSIKVGAWPYEGITKGAGNMLGFKTNIQLFFCTFRVLCCKIWVFSVWKSESVPNFTPRVNFWGLECSIQVESSGVLLCYLCFRRNCARALSHKFEKYQFNLLEGIISRNPIKGWASSFVIGQDVFHKANVSDVSKFYVFDRCFLHDMALGGRSDILHSNFDEGYSYVNCTSGRFARAPPSHNSEKHQRLHVFERVISRTSIQGWESSFVVVGQDVSQRCYL